MGEIIDFKKQTKKDKEQSNIKVDNKYGYITNMRDSLFNKLLSKDKKFRNTKDDFTEEELLQFKRLVIIFGAGYYSTNRAIVHGYDYDDFEDYVWGNIKHYYLNKKTAVVLELIYNMVQKEDVQKDIYALNLLAQYQIIGLHVYDKYSGEYSLWIPEETEKLDNMEINELCSLLKTQKNK